MVTTGESITIVQGSDAWREQRRGNITSSEVYRLMAEPKLKADKEAGNLSEGAKTYIRELIAEDLVPPAAPFENDAIRWGHENEPIARFFYQKSTGIIIETVGYIPSSIFGYGGSPDGITTEQSAAIFGELDRAVMTFEPGCIEIKCPFSTANHIDHCLITCADDLPTQYYWQCMSNIYITDSQWCDFVSFDPRIDHDCGLFIYRVKRDEEAIKKMLDKITRAIAYKQAIKSSLKLV